ncbi:hypothetical protein VE00_09517 [Pseudogymnoascus sp. WSF 3629]|nr:hypothetical protein VE00_09517 [Pseudogymnoascus sp. WSF 3629]
MYEKSSEHNDANLEETYYTGAVLDLYTQQLPAQPTSTHRTYNNGPPSPTQLSERYNKSIAERVALPSTAPAVSITLEERLISSMRRVPHAWTARVQGSSLHIGAATMTHTTYPPQLVVKIYDPVFFDDDETQWDDPFYLRDLAISSEVEAYRRLGPLQGTEVPRFYGYFAAALPAQHGRTVDIILLEKVPGRDLRVIVPPDVAENVCAKHKDAVIDASFSLFFDILAYGVNQQDMQSRNVILRPQKHVSLSVSGTRRFCDAKKCLLALEVDCDDLHMVMVDFEMVDFEEPDPSFSQQAIQRTHIEKIKPMYLKRWLEGCCV